MKVMHRTRGECTVFSIFGSIYELIDSSGSRFQAVETELAQSFVDIGTPVFTETTTHNPSQPFQIQVNINNPELTARELADRVRGIGNVIAKGIIAYRPPEGYRNFDHLQSVLETNNVRFNQATIDAIKEDNSLVFGNAALI